MAVPCSLLRLKARAECAPDCVYMATILVSARQYVRQFSFAEENGDFLIRAHFFCRNDELSKMIKTVIRFLSRLDGLGHNTHRIADTINFEAEFTGKILDETLFDKPYAELISLLKSRCEPWNALSNAEPLVR
jgi:hypothetical protein